MTEEQPPQKTSEPGYGDFVSAAFNHRVPVRGIGGLPVNWLYLAAVAGVSLAAWPLALVGAAGEVAYLTAMAGNPKFQRLVRSRWQSQLGQASEGQLEALSRSLTPQSRARQQALEAKCAEVLQIASTMGQVGSDDLDTYSTHLRELSATYAKMLVLMDMLEKYTRDWDKSDPAPQIASIQAELAKTDLSEAVRASKQATLDILQRRAQSRKDISERSGVVTSEIARLEQQVALLRDQTLLTKDPAVLSQNMDLAAGMLDEHTAWLKDNASFLDTLNQS